MASVCLRGPGELMWPGSVGASLSHWFEPLCVQTSAKVLISAFAPDYMCYLQAPHHLVTLRYEREVHISFCTRG